MEKLDPDFFIKKENSAYHWNNSLKGNKVFIECPSRGLSKCIKTERADRLYKTF